MNLLTIVRESFRDVLTAIAPDASKVPDYLAMIKPTADAKNGDYQANFAMAMSKALGKKPPELAKEIIAMVPGTKSTIDYRELPQEDPKRRRPDITRARTLLGWEPTIDRADGFKRTLDYFKAFL